MSIQEEKVPPTDCVAALINEIKSMVCQLMEQIKALGNAQSTQTVRSRATFRVECYQCGRTRHIKGEKEAVGNSQKRGVHVLKKIRNEKTGAHLLVNKTLNKVRQRFYWVNYCQNVKSWCRQCSTCAAIQGQQTRSRGQIKHYNRGLAFERITLTINALNCLLFRIKKSAQLLMFSSKMSSADLVCPWSYLLTRGETLSPISSSGSVTC